MLDFDYTRPDTIEEALSLRSKWRESSSLLLGGTDLSLAIEEGAVSPDILIDLKKIKELSVLEERDGRIVIGAAVTFSSLIASPLIKEKVPSLWEASRLVASMGVRNSATLIGNICNAVPSAEGAAPLMVRDALVHISSERGDRTVPVETFFAGPRKTVLEADEIVTSVSIPPADESFGEIYLKLGRYRGEDIAQVAVAVHVNRKWEYRIAYGAVGPVPMRIAGAEAILGGKKPDPRLVEKACEAVIGTVSPISDIRASREYRIHMCRIMFEKALEAAVSRMTDGKPEYGARLI